MITWLIMAPAVFWLNRHYGFVASSYIFALMAFVVFFLLEPEWSLKPSSSTFLFYWSYPNARSVQVQVFE